MFGESAQCSAAHHNKWPPVKRNCHCPLHILSNLQSPRVILKKAISRQSHRCYIPSTTTTATATATSHHHYRSLPFPAFRLCSALYAKKQFLRSNWPFHTFHYSLVHNRVMTRLLGLISQSGWSLPWTHVRPKSEWKYEQVRHLMIGEGVKRGALCSTNHPLYRWPSDRSSLGGLESGTV